MRANLVDWSRYQGKTDVALLANKIDGVMARSSIGWSYKDAWYIHNFKTTQAAGKIFAAYHVLWPENNDPKREARWAKDQMVVDGVWPDYQVLDIELMHGRSGTDILQQSEIICKELANLTGLFTVIYTGSWFWNRLPSPGGFEQDFPLIEAEYRSPPTYRIPRVFKFGEEPQGPKKPLVLGRGWTDWWMWQWTSKMEPVGVQSASQDHDVYNGTLEMLEQDLGLGGGQPPVSDKEKLDRLWVHHPELH
jgi:GH25 family lysozyme M1 (1,4-beta-N-acetylmuramidase)